MLKTNKIYLLASVFSILMTTTGCYTLRQMGTPTDSAIEISNVEMATSIKNFTRTKIVNHFVYGLVSPDDAGLEKMVDDEVKLAGGKRAVNVKINYRQTFVNGLVGVLTLGIYTPFTLTVEGDIVK